MNTTPIRALAALLLCSVALAGPLDPPAGAVAPTAKPLSEVEPRTAINATNTPGDADSLFKITQPGSYYLTGNITGVVGRHGIEIAASGVTVDLNGFDLVGVAAMGAFDGVGVTVASLTSIAVVNGSVRNWGDEAVDLGTSNAINCRVEGVRASGNGGSGISVGSGTTVSNCTAYQNTGHGISSGALGITVSNCTAYQNTGHGISSAGSGSTVSNCTAYQNTGNGISVGSGSTVADCIARISTLNGIVCASACIIRGNTCSNNGSGGDGAGIHAFGNDNRIEGNNCTGADRGIDVDNAGNIIIRNTCSGNTTNWDIVANNVCGPIIDRSAPASAAILGNSAPDSTGSTHPNANFTY
ncbi:MAG: right-handed parallel beta-helix repeat-containing protein [Phycisphaerales bacterium]|nr:right-handed parallel beta-helix repeat-containing protein [Phycisphaerales bacterium]